MCHHCLVVGERVSNYHPRCLSWGMSPEVRITNVGFDSSVGLHGRQSTTGHGQHASRMDDMATDSSASQSQAGGGSAWGRGMLESASAKEVRIIGVRGFSSALFDQALR